MKKIVTASLLLILISIAQNKIFAATLTCKFKDTKVNGVKSIEINDENLVINSEMEIPLEKTRVNCGNFGRQVRFDGNALGFQVVLRSCTSDAALEGHIIDEVQSVAGDVFCYSESKK